MKFLILYVSIVVVFTTTANAASFDCDKAKRANEVLICKSPTLSALDDALNILYNAAIAASPDSQGLKTAQAQWVVSTQACSDEACLLDSYQSRIQQLATSPSHNGGPQGSTVKTSDLPIVSPVSGEHERIQTAFVNSPTDGFLALRSQPTLSNGIRISRIPHDTEITLTECQSAIEIVGAKKGQWCRATYGSEAGWVFDGYVTRKNTSAPLADRGIPVVQEQANPANSSDRQLSPPDRSAHSKPNSEERRTVTSHGLGVDVDAALRNAAENALTEVVGTFIDAEHRLQKRSVIEDGIRSTTKQLSSNVQSYSQGNIEKIVLISSSSDGSLTRVQAEVTVKVEDFKAFIKKIVHGEQNVNSGLLAQLDTSKKQETNITDLIVKKVVQAIAIDPNLIITVGSIEPAVGPVAQELLPTNSSNRFSIKFQVNASLAPEFLDKIYKILQETAEKRITGQDAYHLDKYPAPVIGLGAINSANHDNYKSLGYDSFHLINWCSTASSTRSSVLCRPLIWSASSMVEMPNAIAEIPSYYILPERYTSDICSALSQKDIKRPTIIVQYLHDSDILFQQEIKWSDSATKIGYYSNERDIWVGSNEMPFGYTKNSLTTNQGKDPVSFLFVDETYKDAAKQGCLLNIAKETSFYLYVSVPEETLKKTTKIRVSYS